jgi:hypothetical protein
MRETWNSYKYGANLLIKLNWARIVSIHVLGTSIHYISIQSLCLSGCRQQVAHNSRALKVYVTKGRLRLELTLELD